MRIATLAVIVIASATVAHTQTTQGQFQLPRRERPARPIFQTAPLDLRAASTSPRPASPTARPRAVAPQPVPPALGEGLCLSPFRADASIDPKFLWPIPDGVFTMIVIPVPPCVTVAPQPPR